MTFLFFDATPFQLDSYEIAEGKSLKINVSEPKTRLFLGNIPKSKDKEEIEEELRKLYQYVFDLKILYASKLDEYNKQCQLACKGI